MAIEHRISRFDLGFQLGGKGLRRDPSTDFFTGG